jgi:undecaprenyl diphosphate synthase
VGVYYFKFYAFSTENWKRPADELNGILSVIESTALRFRSRLKKDNMQLKIIGDVWHERVPESLRNLLLELQNESRQATLHARDATTFCIAFNYGGRQDIVAAAKQIARLVLTNKTLCAEDVTEDLVASCLSTAGMPDPELMIRTSGECRLSNFLLWNVAYTELYFTDIYWPDFDKAALEEALEWYAGRQRRFGARTCTRDEDS